MALKSVTVFLVVDSYGNCRIMKRASHLKYNEMAFPVTIDLPQVWGVVHHEINTRISVVDQSVPTISVGQGQAALAEDVVKDMAKDLGV